MKEIPGSEFELKADLVLLAMGFVHPVHDGLAEVARREAGRARQRRGQCDELQDLGAEGLLRGDMRRGQSLVVWAIREGRQAARAVDEYLMGTLSQFHIRPPPS
jgi:glutamate synthase (NADPH) small chain